MKEEFFRSNTLSIVIINQGEESMTACRFNAYTMIQKNHSINYVTPNVLYRLRENHPVIDGVGLLCSDLGKYYLLFVQISLESYKRHRTRLPALLADKRNVNGYEELSDKNLTDYPSVELPSSLLEYY